MEYDLIKGLAASKTLINLSIASPRVIICLKDMLKMSTAELERELTCAFYSDAELARKHEECLERDEMDVFLDSTRGKLSIEDEDVCVDILMTVYRKLADPKHTVRASKNYTVADVKRAIRLIYEKMNYNLDSRSQGNLVKVLLENISEEERITSIKAMHDLICNDFMDGDFVVKLSRLDEDYVV